MVALALPTEKPRMVWLSWLGVNLQTEKVLGFDSRSGHMPGLQARSPVTNVSLPLSKNHKLKKALAGVAQ